LLANTTDVPRSRARRAGARPGPPEDALSPDVSERLLERNRAASVDGRDRLARALRRNELRSSTALSANSASAIEDGVENQRNTLRAVGVVLFEKAHESLGDVPEPEENDPDFLHFAPPAAGCTSKVKVAQ
jgi:hypothetical protein